MVGNISVLNDLGKVAFLLTINWAGILKILTSCSWADPTLLNHEHCEEEQLFLESSNT